MKITLVNLPVNCKGNLSDIWYEPLGLVHIASFLSINGYKAKIVDGNMHEKETINNISDGDIVGISFNSFNVPEMELLAERAKIKNAFVVLGGHAASSIPEQFLKENNNIDAVVVGDGEWAMLELGKALSARKDLRNVPNLVYRSGTEIVTNTRQELPLSQLPMPRRDIGGLNPFDYINNYESTCTDPIVPGRRATNVVTRKGCPRRAAGRGCSFCARIDKKVRSRTPLQAWQEYKYLADEYGINYIYEDSDSWIHVPWLKKLEKIWSENGGLDVQFRIYGDIRDISEESVSLLKKLNVDTILFGIESGDRNILLRNGKDFAWHDVEKACCLLSDAEISITDAYVLGLAGENRDSIEKTISLSEKIKSICKVYTTYWNIMLPLPGSPSWEMLLSNSKLSKQFNSSYKYDPDLVRQEFFSNCTKLGPNALNELTKLRAQLCQKSSMPVCEYIR